MFRLIGYTILAVLLSGCADQPQKEVIVVDNTMLSGSGAYSLHVTPNPINPHSRLAITLDVEQEFDIEARLLLIDHAGKVLQEFEAGEFAMGSYEYSYTPDPELPVGDYYIILADENNLILEGVHLRSTTDVLKELRADEE